MVKIIEVRKDSPAEKAGLTPNMRILTINGHTIEDPVDYIFYSNDSSVIELYVQDGTKKKTIQVEADSMGHGIELEPFKIKECTNDCVFCFVDQNPPGARESLFVKDDDYRLSFLNGNFTTLTNLRSAELKRISKMGLSPLFISVHTTNQELRRTMLGRKRIPDIMEQIGMFAKEGISMHTQVVLVPGMNDGKYLLDTINDLVYLRPHVKSLGIVPVGLTKYRTNTLDISEITSDYATEIINQLYILRRDKPELRDFVYLSDEWFLKADYPIPPNNYYSNYPQIENGIGMVRQFLNAMMKHPISKNGNRHKRTKVHLITGESFAPILTKHLAPRISKVQIVVHPVFNRYWGRSVTVGNLLAGGDIAEELKKIPNNEPIILPPRVINEEWMFSDGYHIETLEKELNNKVYIAPEDPAELIRFIDSVAHHSRNQNSGSHKSSNDNDKRRNHEEKNEKSSEKSKTSSKGRKNSSSKERSSRDSRNSNITKAEPKTSIKTTEEKASNIPKTQPKKEKEVVDKSAEKPVIQTKATEKNDAENNSSEKPKRYTRLRDKIK